MPFLRSKWAVVALGRVSGSSQTAWLSVGHQEPKLDVNVMVDEDYLTMPGFLLTLLWVPQPLYSNPHDVAADSISDRKYPWNFQAKRCNPLFIYLWLLKKRTFLSKLFHRSVLEHSSLLSKADQRGECVINLIAREISALNQLNQKVSRRAITEPCAGKPECPAALLALLVPL